MASIHQRAVLFALRISSWSAKKYDKQVSKDAAEAHGTDESAGRYNKNLLPSTVKSIKVVEKVSKKGKRKTETITIETNSHKELMAHIAAVRVWVYEQTLEWADGERMLPMANWTFFMDGIRERKRTFDRLLPAFLADYPKLVSDARRILNGMFKESDYPEDIAAKFKWETAINPVPEADFRVKLSADEIAALTASAEAGINSRVEAAQESAVKRLFTCVEKIHARLADKRVAQRTRTVKKPVMQPVIDATGNPVIGDDGNPVMEKVREQVGTHEKTGKPIFKTVYESVVEKSEVETTEVFRDTLIDNARELCEVLTRLNVADDLKLEKFRRETEKLASVDPESIRNDVHAAQRTADKAQAILDAMTATYGNHLFGGK